MELYPQDLGLKRHLALIRGRAAAMGNQGNAAAATAYSAGEPSTARLGPLGRFWTRGANIEPRAAAASLTAMRGFTYGMVGGMVGGSTGFWIPGLIAGFQGQPVLGIICTLLGLGMSGVGLVVPGIVFRGLHKRPVGSGEIEAMLPLIHDDLERAYLTLVLDAIRQEVPDEAEKDVRAALHALGDAIDRLPAASMTPADTQELRGEAAAARAQAQSEPDTVVAASLERRAEALERSAEAADRSAVLMRRSAALREEMRAQTEALRLGLIAYYTGAADIANLTHLSEAVRGVATEAVSVAHARQELDTVVLSPSPPSEPPAAVRVGQR